MSTLRTAIDPASPAYAEAADAMSTKLAELDAELAKALAGGGAKYVERHHARGKLTARERIELLVDPDSPFLELCPLAAFGSSFQVGASLVTGQTTAPTVGSSIAIGSNVTLPVLVTTNV